MARSCKWFKPPRSSRVARSYIQLPCLIIGGYDVRKMPHEPNYSILMHTIDLSHIALISNHAPASDHPTTPTIGRSLVNLCHRTLKDGTGITKLSYGLPEILSRGSFSQSWKTPTCLKHFVKDFETNQSFPAMWLKKKRQGHQDPQNIDDGWGTMRLSLATLTFTWCGHSFPQPRDVLVKWHSASSSACVWDRQGSGSARLCERPCRLVQPPWLDQPVLF